MLPSMSARRLPWKWIVVSVLLVALGAVIVVWQSAVNGMVHAYYDAEYQPVQLTPADVKPAPASFRLDTVSWRSSELDLPQPLAFAMLAGQAGAVESLEAIEFYTGATWGASPVPHSSGFYPGPDAELVYRQGAAAMGLTRRYLVTDDQARYLAALKGLLASGRPVRVAIDRDALLGESGTTAHSIVLVGYDEGHFEYYEPTCTKPERCRPGTAVPGQPGLMVETQRFLVAVESLALVFQYPWKYQLLVLEPGEKTVTQAEVVARNAAALIGTKVPGGPPGTGAKLVLDGAKALRDHGKDIATDEFTRGLHVAGPARLSDARALEELLPPTAPVVEAAHQLALAAAAYTAADEALRGKHLEAVDQALLAAAEADRKAGEALKNYRADEVVPDAGP
jgi:hypothetical protein